MFFHSKRSSKIITICSSHFTFTVFTCLCSLYLSNLIKHKFKGIIKFIRWEAYRSGFRVSLVIYRWMPASREFEPHHRIPLFPYASNFTLIRLVLVVQAMDSIGIFLSIFIVNYHQKWRADYCHMKNVVFE